MLPRLPANATPDDLERHYAAGMLRKESLQHGAYYKGRCRNATLALWDAPTQSFVHWRKKFDARFLESIRHPVDEARFDVFIPEQLASAEEVAAADAHIAPEQLHQFLNR